MTPDRAVAKKAAKVAGLAIAIFGVFIYLSTTCLWVLVYWVLYRSDPRTIDGSSLWHAVPSPLLLTMFIVALVKGRNSKVFAILLTTALLLIVGWSTFDYHHNNYQLFEHNMNGKGSHYHYFNWPWLSS